MKFIVYVFIVDYNGECDSEQDVDNSFFCLNGIKNRWFILLCVFRVFIIFFVIYEFIVMLIKLSEYVVDVGNIKVCFNCMCFKIIVQIVILR